MVVMLVMVGCHQHKFAYIKEVDLQRVLERIVLRRAGERRAKSLICSLAFLVLTV